MFFKGKNMQFKLMASLLFIPALMMSPVQAEENLSADATTAIQVETVTEDGDKETYDDEHVVRIKFNDDEEESDGNERFALGILKTVAISLESIPESVRAEMSEEDKENLEKALAEVEALSREKEQHLQDPEHSGKREVVIQSSDWSDSIDVVGLVAVLLIFGSPVLIVFIVSYNRRRKREMVHGTIDKMIEMGQDVPVEMLDALDKGDGAKPTVQKAYVNIAIGLGAGIALMSLAGADVATLALIPLFIGLAQLLVNKLEKDNIE